MGGETSDNASATNCGPKADPPIPTERTWVNLSAVGGLMVPAWTCCTNSAILAQGSVISFLTSSLGANSGARNQ